MFLDGCHRTGIPCAACAAALSVAESFDDDVWGRVGAAVGERYRLVVESMWRSCRRRSTRAGARPPARAPRRAASDAVERIRGVLAAEGEKVKLVLPPAARPRDMLRFAGALRRRGHPDKNGGRETGVDMDAVRRAVAELKPLA